MRILNFQFNFESPLGGFMGAHNRLFGTFNSQHLRFCAEQNTAFSVSKL